MKPSIEIIFFVFLAFIFWMSIRNIMLKVTVFEFERGLQYVKGRYKKLLGPGEYWILKTRSSITKVDVRPKVIAVPGQEILSADSIALKISLAAQYEIVDPSLVINKVGNYMESLHLILQMAARDLIGSQKVDDLLEQRQALSEKLFELTAPKALELGIKLHSINLKDLMFPGDLKKIFAQVVKARKEGLAALEKARGESAALRNLANAAKVLENNPELMQLRILQSVGESSGHTLVLGMPPGSLPFPVRGKTDAAASSSPVKPDQEEQE